MRDRGMRAAFEARHTRKEQGRCEVERRSIFRHGGKVGGIPDRNRKLRYKGKVHTEAWYERVTMGQG